MPTDILELEQRLAEPASKSILEDIRERTKIARNLALSTDDQRYWDIMREGNSLLEYLERFDAASSQIEGFYRSFTATVKRSLTSLQEERQVYGECARLTLKTGIIHLPSRFCEFDGTHSYGDPKGDDYIFIVRFRKRASHHHPEDIHDTGRQLPVADRVTQVKYRKL